MPRTRGTAPSYATGRFDPAKLDGRLLPVVAAEASAEVVGIAQDMTIYLGRAQAGGLLDFRQEPGRRIFIYLIGGQITLNGDAVLKPGDSARIEGVSHLELQADGDMLVMLIDLP
jgi:redox-sensitive bicupin YhaK (pirin superfamily)